MNIKPIGFVRNEVLSPHNDEWGEDISEIIVNKEYAIYSCHNYLLYAQSIVY